MCSEKYPNATYMGGHSNPLILKHTYREEGIYMVRAVASDSKVSKTNDLQVVIASLPCNMPVVTIVKKMMDYTNAPKNWRSLSYVQSATAQINCSHSVPVSRWWKVLKVKRDTGEPEETINIEGVLPSWNFSQLDITPLFLQVGVYKLSYTIRLNASKIFPLQREDYTYIEIIPDFNITWWCRQLKPTQETFNIVDDNDLKVYNIHPVPAPGTLEYSDGTLNLQTSSFIREQGTYEITALVSKDTRKQYTTVQVEVMQHPPPQLNVKCVEEKLCLPYNGGLLVNPSSRLALMGNCVDMCEGEMKLEWTIMNMTGDPVNETDPGPDFCKPEECKPVFITTKAERNLAVNPIFFSINKNIEKFRFRLTMTSSTESRGFAEIVVIPNKPPIDGTCKLRTETVRALLDSTLTSCSDWKDPEKMGIVSYSFYYREENAEKTMVSSGFANVNLVFPVGYFEIRCKIQDKFGSFTSVFVGNVNATMISEADFKAYNPSSVLQNLAAIGDQATLGMVLVGISSIRENADWLSLDSLDSLESFEGEANDKLTQVSAMNKESLSFASSTMDFASLSQLNVGACVLKSSSCGILTQEMAAFTVDMEFRDMSIQFMKKMAAKLNTTPIYSPYDLQPFVSCFLDASVCILRSMNEIILNPDRSPPTDLKEAKDWNYETVIDGKDYNVEVPEDRITQLKKNVHATTISRAKSMLMEMFELIDFLCINILSKSVVGEVINEKSESGAGIFVAKYNEKSLSDGLQIDPKNALNASVTFPSSFCPSKSSVKDAKCDNIFGVAVVVWPCLTHVYPESMKFLTPESFVLSIKLFIEERHIQVKNLTAPILLAIPRTYKQLPKPVLTVAKTYINRHVPFVYHQFNVSNNNSAFTVDITPKEDIPPNLVILIDHKRLPTPSQYDKILFVRDLPLNDNGSYSWFVNSQKNRNRIGFYLAVAILKKELDLSQNLSLKNKDFHNKFDFDYEILVTSSGCYYYDTQKSAWQGSDLECVAATDTHVYCNAHHLTPFGSGHFHVENKIDFEYIYANLGFTSNITIYLMVIITLVCYILTMIWARFMDKKDVEHRGVLPLENNSLEDKYLYEITLTTGPDKEAGTNSHPVHIIRRI
ncbi:Polycystic kidney disease and receptor for egg jelly-related protein-like [Homarus americanus]|uniref:Polycystic kidney disease and receptor for egg jelly-related protein-like n=1 Tax=Homarus americanus TaxID=6706 RepID=A0A8J5MT66_HOMAM|nr:Polycystic kidney disease and receptor for egg jelly-related protein-like [Homarus americanus]